MKSFKRLLLVLGLIFAGFLPNPNRLTNGSALTAEAAPSAFSSPWAAVFSPSGTELAVSDHTDQSLHIVDLAPSTPTIRKLSLPGNPTSLAWPREGLVLIALVDQNAVLGINPEEGTIVSRYPTGAAPTLIRLTPDLNRLIAVNSLSDSVSIIELATGITRAELPATREPFGAAIAPDGVSALISNLLPSGSATDAYQSAVLDLLDLKQGRRTATIPLPPGSALVREVTLSPDGRWGYAVHCVGRTNMPTTQLDRGWVNTNALTIIDLRSMNHYATLLLDHPFEGAADPWGLALSSDGSVLWITLSGSHQLARVEVGLLHDFLEGNIPEGHRLLQSTGSSVYQSENVWLKIRKEPRAREDLVNDLSSLYSAELIERIKLPGQGPRGLALNPSGSLLAIPLYYSSRLVLLDTETKRPIHEIQLGPKSEESLVRRGERVFHDATQCFQHWMSCATCHPNARVDGMNWDLLNDGIGNPKNTRSMLWSSVTPPVMSLGVRADMETAVEAGFRHILFRVPEPEDVTAVKAYLRSLKPYPSPHLNTSGQFTASARRGESLFNSTDTGCAACHRPPLFTDLKMHDVGTKGDYDRASSFDTPTLVELYRSAPYLHDGAAASLMEILTTHNREDRHGTTSHLSESDLNDLVAYLLAL